ncbi:peptidase T [Jeotgalicoccus coquinae]|uniref:Peptidase T n=1 Tax=Jeotgalicoccus coquinae TaxID=709509 RepID=A0A6V7RR78_9STAP|nr:peptidase T [Jeotgalicoccus coquinae]MBB6424226.1 tripeptide aminopeptidase [Jeotgalicoccus coquinae]GGE25475.1 peptidase T [Jeotgalicoccus coquinae]CAD2081569.1 Peptidase T [Jeotgalicoccus coquinae]
MKENLIERLSRYAKIDTQSDASSETVPSTDKQWDLLKELETELNAIGMSDVNLDDKGYLFATLPANTEGKKTIGFLAHVDTATDFTGTNVKPQLVKYEGGSIVLNEALNIVLTPEQFPNLNNYKGHTLMTTDGTTLLGADNKAGVAEIITAVEYLLKHPEIKHGAVKVGFTPDEEIGRGPHDFDVERFDADFAYTVDGGPLGELQYESFNAAGAAVRVTGNSVHPGTAKNKMVNAVRIAADIITGFDAEDTPEKTEGYEGFNHVLNLTGDVETAEFSMIIRDFETALFKARKEAVEQKIKEFQEKYPEAEIELDMADQYYNMKEVIEKDMTIVKLAEEAMKSLDIEPVIEPIRGGTDGSQLSYKGLPAPNIFTGGENFHGKFEFASIDDMEKSANTIVKIIELNAK